MSVKAELNAKPRSETGKGAARRLRREGRVPAVVYGGETESTPISIDAGEAVHLFQRISVENTLVDLKLEGEDQPLVTLVREVQAHPYKSELVHVDFYRITEGKAIEVEVPVHLNGVPQGVRESGGVLEQIVHELPVKCIPSKIPESIEFDVTELGMNEAIHVSDVELDPDVEILLPGERAICTVVAPKIVLEEPEVEEEEELEVALVGEEEEEALAEGEVPEEEAEEGPGEVAEGEEE